jgi:HPt (histidine-containing phosphotransfer) domain-containing protein
MSVKLINLSYLETMSDGDAEMMQTMLEMLMVEVTEEIEKMQHETQAKNWKEVFEISHKLKTTLSFVGNEEMININKTIEHCARHVVDTEELPNLVNQLSTYAEPVLQELETVKL